MRKLLSISLPFLILVCLLAFLMRELFYSNPNIRPSPLIDEPVPSFSLPDLFNETVTFTQKELQGKVSLLNVWASWCYACSVEHPLLMEITKKYHIPIYGIAYKDNAADARAILTTAGNPYVLTGNDVSGNVAIDLGVYGTPETFIISPEGKIVYRYVGAISQKAWDEELYPIIKKYEHE